MLEALIAELECCKRLLVQVTGTIGVLNSTSGQYSEMSGKLALDYTVDDERTPVNEKVDRAEEKIRKISAHLSGVTIPKINARIAELSALIAELMAKMQEEAAGGSR